MKPTGNLTYSRRQIRKLVSSCMWCHVLWRRTQPIYLKRRYTYTSLLDVTFRKIPVTIHQSTRCDILEDTNIHKDNGENIRYRNSFRVQWQCQYVLQNRVKVRAGVCVCVYVYHTFSTFGSAFLCVCFSPHCSCCDRLVTYQDNFPNEECAIWQNIRERPRDCYILIKGASEPQHVPHILYSYQPFKLSICIDNTILSIFPWVVLQSQPAVHVQYHFSPICSPSAFDLEFALL